MIALLLLVQITSANADKVQQTATFKEAKSAILCLAFSPNGSLLASGEVDRKIRLWDLSTGKQTAVLEGHQRQVATVAFSADGSTLASAGYDHTVRLWDVASGKLKETQAGDPKVGVVPLVDDMRAQFNRDLSLLATGSYGGLWDLRAKKEIVRNSLVVHAWFDFSSDSNFEKNTGQFRYFELWDAKGGKSVDKWDGTADAMYERVTWSGDGTIAAVIDAGGDGDKWKLEIWNVAAKKKSSSPGFHKNTVNGMAFTPDGSAVATASLDKTLKFWDAKSGKELASYSHGRGFMGLAFDPAGKRAATADDTGAIQVWALK